jgi:hypothetical protein
MFDEVVAEEGWLCRDGCRVCFYGAETEEGCDVVRERAGSSVLHPNTRYRANRKAVRDGHTTAAF